MSDSEGIHDLVAFSRGNAEALGTLTARLDKIEMDNRALRETVAQLVNDATAGSRSAPGPTTRYRDVTTSRATSPFRHFNCLAPFLKMRSPSLAS
jgi:hypothetical protein